ncbi:MAG: FeoB-associated Cys-rich membrane protein [Clostridia bacterium]|jgi:hypothetical protein|nr:FeoB-associated Cys-rich membrane protein [Clostridia bacterium]
MLNFFISNIGTIIVSLILLIIVGFAVRSLISNKKNGKSSCGCGCANCPSAGICHGAKK